jgi:hypothetical protein
MSPSGLGYVRAAGLALLVWLGATGGAVAGETAKEFWPEVDLWLRLTPAWRLSMFASLSNNKETDYREGSVLLQADYAWGKTGRFYSGRLFDESRAEGMKAMLVRAGYLSGESLADNGEAYQERAMTLEWHVRNPLKGRVLLSHRLRADLRWLGDDADFSSRWRYRLMVEKEVDAGRCSLVPFGNVEAYYDTRYDTVNRVRLVGGTSASWSPRCALEGNITYQHDSESSVTNLYALNVIVHVFFARHQGK